MPRLTRRAAVGLCLFCALLFAACGDDSSSESDSFDIPIENDFPGVLTAAQEREIYDAIERFAQLNYRATVLLNSLFFADFERTPPEVILNRAVAAGIALEDVLAAVDDLVAVEQRHILPAVASLNRREKTLQAKVRAKKKADSGGDVARARSLLNLYYNDDAFYRKYKLSDIARVTGVSTVRLLAMQRTAEYAFTEALENESVELYDQAVRNTKAIRDTSVTALGVVATIYTGGAASAGSVSLLAKGAKVIETASTVLSVGESATSLVNAALGTDDVPAPVKFLNEANKVVSYALLPKALIGGGLGAIVSLTTPANDAADKYFKVNTDTGTVTVSSNPQDETSTIQRRERRETLDDLLLPGDYRIPRSTLKNPTKTNSGFSFVDDPQSEEDFTLDVVNMADLWDLPGAPTDNFGWDTEKENPDSSMEPASSNGPDPEDSLLAGDELLFHPSLVAEPAVTVTARPGSGPAPLIVDFSASLDNPDNETFDYTWHFGDGGYLQSSLAAPVHTYTEAGTYTAVVYVKGESLHLMGSVKVVVGSGEQEEPDVDGDINHPCRGGCDRDEDQPFCLDADTLCACDTPSGNATPPSSSIAPESATSPARKAMRRMAAIKEAGRRLQAAAVPRKHVPAFANRERETRASRLWVGGAGTLSVSARTPVRREPSCPATITAWRRRASSPAGRFAAMTVAPAPPVRNFDVPE